MAQAQDLLPFGVLPPLGSPARRTYDAMMEGVSGTRQLPTGMSDPMEGLRWLPAPSQRRPSPMRLQRVSQAGPVDDWLENSAPDPRDMGVLKSIPSDEATELMHGPRTRALGREYTPGVLSPFSPEGYGKMQAPEAGLRREPSTIGRMLGLNASPNQFMLDSGGRKLADMAAAPAISDIVPKPSGSLIHDAMNAVGFALGGMGGSGPGSHAVFAGPMARTANLPAMREALALERRGAPRQEIIDQTGWFQGADKKWRFEIHDKSAQVMPGHHTNPDVPLTIGPLESYLGHNELYSAYPQIAKAQTAYGAKVESPGAASFQYADTPHGHGGSPGEFRFGSGTFANTSVPLHEAQHAIQKIEGFAAGGMPVATPKLRFDPLMQDVAQEYNVLNTKLRKFDTGRLHGTIPTAKDYARRDELQQILRKYYDYNNAGKAKAFENYQRLGGEVEARNVETRLPFSRGERQAIAPWVTEHYDTPRGQQALFNEPMWSTPYGHSRVPTEIPPARPPAQLNREYIERFNKPNWTEAEKERIIQLRKIMDAYMRPGG